tara:strand:- start:23 stop:262 length:240 start_codon:yes stop_codon:yes gene_type:complete
MGAMDDYSIDQLMLFIVGVAGAAGALCLSIQKSKCKKLKLCCGLVDCDRDTKAIIEEEKLALGKLPTPRELEPKIKITK